MKTLKIILKWSMLTTAAIAIIFTGLWLLNSPETLSENSQSKLRLDRADHTLASIDLDFVDSTRSTPALGEFKGDDSRTLKGTIWFPKGHSSDHPLVIFSHGFGSYHKGSKHIAKYLARNGYVVAAVDFPLSNMRSLAGSPQLLDVVRQPGDVSAVIDQVLTLNNDPNSAIYKRVAPDRIGAYGLSLGGLTTALVSFHPDFKDERIQAAVMMAPPLEGFNEQFYATNQTVNSLILSGTMDRVVPELNNATQAKNRHPNGWFLSFDKGSHLGFANVSNPIRWMENPDNMGCALMDVMLSKIDLPERWDDVIPDTGSVLLDVMTTPPCPEILGQSMNGLKQQWLTRIAIGSFFDMHLRTGERAESAAEFFTQKLSSENPELRLTSPL